jgi:hypothetical protein
VKKQEIDDYLAALDEPKRRTLDEPRKTILAVIPEAEQCNRLRPARVQAEREGDSRVRRIQEPPELFSSQRVRDRRAQRRHFSVCRVEGNIAVSRRHSPAGKLVEELITVRLRQIRVG